MNKPITPHNKGEALPVRPSRARVSAKTREAINYLVTKACTHEEAATLAGMHRSALSRALSKPHTQAALEEARSAHIKQIMSRKGLYKALAWEKLHELAHKSKDERVQLKAVELLTGEGKSGPAVSVSINTGNGYEFVRPGQKVVEIEGTPDHGSSASDVQDIDDAEELPDVE